MVKAGFCGGAAYDLVHQDYNTMMPDTENYEGVLNNGGNNSNHETLALFPLHPTGVLEGRATLMSSLGSTTSAGNSTTPTSSCETSAGIGQEGSGEQHLFDFFSCQGSSESD